MPTLLVRMNDAGFTVRLSVVHPFFDVQPSDKLTEERKEQIAMHHTELLYALFDEVFPPISDEDRAHIAALLHAGPAAEGMF